MDKSYTLGLHKIVTSTWLKNLMEERFGVSASGPLPNGINPDLFYKETEGFESHNPKRIGMLYRRQEWKGMKDGFKAFAIAKKKCPGIQLVLFGETPLARRNPGALCVALHPGSVDTALSKPFQAGIPVGKLFTPRYAAERLLGVIDSLAPADSGGVFAWDGSRIPF